MTNDKNNVLRKASNEMELVDFRLYEDRGDEVYEGVYGINVAKVKSIVAYPNEVFESPASPDYLLGTFDLRGEILPLIDLATWMNIKPKEEISKDKKVIVTEFNNKQMGFVVHATSRLRRISWADIESGSFSLSNNDQRGKITGVTRIEDGRTLLILDLEGILDDLDFNTHENDDTEDFKIKNKFSGNVLIVDDSSIARKLLKKTLSDIGFTIIEAVDGQDGLDKLEQLHKNWGNSISTQIRLIVSDIEMPKMDGFHFAANVKNDQRFSSIPVIFNSSISDKMSADRGKEIGAESYLVKFDPKRFYNEISRILSK